MMAGAAPGHVVFTGINSDWVMAGHRAAGADLRRGYLALDVISTSGDRLLTEAGVA